MKDYYNNSLTSWVPDDARTAVVNYGEYGEVVLPMGTFAETVGNFNQLQNSNRIGGRTNTKEALDLAKSLFDMTDFREHAVVLITDKQPENSICQDWPESITTAVITTFGNASSQLDCIVSESSDNGDSFYYKTVSNISNLSTVSFNENNKNTYMGFCQPDLPISGVFPNTNEDLEKERFDRGGSETVSFQNETWEAAWPGFKMIQRFT
eukprot:UN27984